MRRLLLLALLAPFIFGCVASEQTERINACAKSCGDRGYAYAEQDGCAYPTPKTRTCTCGPKKGSPDAR